MCNVLETAAGICTPPVLMLFEAVLDKLDTTKTTIMDFMSDQQK